VAYHDFLQTVHTRTPRNYVQRVVEYDKAECAEIARRFDKEYWDGDRKYGYGGYKYDGRWVAVAQRLAAHYQLKAGARILDIGCAKGFLMHDLMQAVPGVSVTGLDVSRYALEHAVDDVRGHVLQGTAAHLPFADKSFDFVVSVNTLHNLRVFELDSALREIERVSRGPKYIVVDTFRNEREKVNLLYWQLTCQCFYTPEDWHWWFERTGYSGDHSFVWFE
jgi:protein-L-isoaspartate(D-aspartate) O-methyltransferase